MQQNRAFLGMIIPPKTSEILYGLDNTWLCSFIISIYLKGMFWTFWSRWSKKVNLHLYILYTCVWNKRRPNSAFTMHIPLPGRSPPKKKKSYDKLISIISLSSFYSITTLADFASSARLCLCPAGGVSAAADPSGSSASAVHRWEKCNCGVRQGLKTVHKPPTSTKGTLETQQSLVIHV